MGSVAGGTRAALSIVASQGEGGDKTSCCSPFLAAITDAIFQVDYVTAHGAEFLRSMIHFLEVKMEGGEVSRLSDFAVDGRNMLLSPQTIAIFLCTLRNNFAKIAFVASSKPQGTFPRQSRSSSDYRPWLDVRVVEWMLLCQTLSGLWKFVWTFAAPIHQVIATGDGSNGGMRALAANPTPGRGRGIIRQAQPGLALYVTKFIGNATYAFGGRLPN
ncbi:hypothetical protein OG21DRAFT_1490438 [Imleria badia]|nr:hypothetical protein OG21DRAFT_1490438 [Imleria badia]